MSSISLYQKRARSSSGWGSWTTVSGVDIVDQAVGYYVVYSASLSLTGGQHLNSVSVATNFVSRGATSQRTLTCYVYTFDPTSYSSPPGGYIASQSQYSTFGTYGVYVTFNFTGLDVASGTRLYFWFSDTVSGASDYQYSYNTGNGVLGDPYCSGGFSAAALSLSLSSANVTTGGNQVVTIGNGNGRSVTVRVKYGNKQLYAASTSNGSLTIPVSKSWFTTAGLTSVTSFSVGVSIDEDSTLYQSFDVTAGSDMNPSVSNVTTEIVQSGNAATYFPSTYLAHISKCKVSARAATGSNAAIRSVVLTYPGGSPVALTYNSSTGKYEGTTAALTTNVAFTVTATDARGFTGSAVSGTVTVVQYSKPAININSKLTYRCNASGTQESGGAYWRACASATYYTNLSGNSLLQFKVQISTGTIVNLSSGVQSAVQGGTLNQTTNYTLTFTIQDKVSETITKTFALESITRNVVIRRNNTGTAAGIGTTPQRAEGSSVELPLAGDFLMGGIPAQAFHIPYNEATDGASFGKDPLNIDRTQRRATENAASFFYKTANNSEWSNLPLDYASRAWLGFREVYWMSEYYQMVSITEMIPYPGRVWTNLCINGTWNGWRAKQAVTLTTS